MNTLFFFNIGSGEIIVIILAILIFFGGKKIPELMKGIGKGIKSFKDGVSGLDDDSNSSDKDSSKKE